MFAAEAVGALAFEAIMGEEFDIVARLAILGQIRQYLADDTAKFEAMTRAGGSIADLGMVGVEINEKVPIRRIGEHAGFKRHQWAGRCGKVTGDTITQDHLIFKTDLAAEFSGVPRSSK